MSKKINDTEMVSLLLNFNNRDDFAFSRVYDIVYDEIFYFTSNLYRDTEIVASDIIHDIFIKMWESKKIKFCNILSVKAYIYIAVKNKFRDYLSHRKCVNKYVDVVKVEDNYFVSQIAESETLSIISEAMTMLPAECAKVFSLFIDGWDVKDIATQLNKSQSTIYAQKQEAISILKRKIFKDKMLIIMMLLNP